MTNDTIDANDIVHESETQRRHARIKLPCKIEIDGHAEGDEAVPVVDLSASGFAIENSSIAIPSDRILDGKLTFIFDSVLLAIKVRFRVNNQETEAPQRYGCEFEDLGPEEVSTLRNIISRFLSGELVTAGDTLATLSRDNFNKARTDLNQPLEPGEKIRAVTLTSIFLLVSLVGFAYVVYNLYNTFFVIAADTAIVAVETTHGVAPRSGELNLLVEKGDTVRVGQAIAEIRAPMLADTSVIAESIGFDQGELDELISRTVASTVTSSCDCEVLSTEVPQGGYVEAGQTIINYAGNNTQAVVLARFPHKELQTLVPGTAVHLRVDVNGDLRTGKITKVEIPENIFDEEHKVHSLLVTIVPDEVIPREYAQRPVTVTIGELTF